ncbi:transcription factor GLABRA 3 [Citrus sinensis]|nr:transcription factor GLABRA 3 [Citrus sinensis]
MDTTKIQNQKRVPESLKKQLALAVRSIQWSYAIFWTISDTQPGVLEWGDGYYNGDIKTRKTIQSVELSSNQLGLQRSEQLRELYESLSAGESHPQAASKRPSAALSPEDLTDTEWYYLVCMSFNFNIGEGLPGRALANNQPIWLCNAQYADSKVFSRSLLAKVLEEPDFIQHIKTSFMEIPCPMISGNSSSGAGNMRDDKDLACAALCSQNLDTTMVPVVGYEVLEMASPDNNGSSGIKHNQPADYSFMVGGINGVASQVQSWQVMDDEFSNCVHSVNSSDSISQTLVDATKCVSASKDDKKIGHCLQEVEECNPTELTSLDPQGHDLLYQSVLSSLLKTSHQLVSRPHFQNHSQESSFASWKKGGLVSCKKQRDGVSQKLLKKILFEVPRIINYRLLESSEDNHIKDDVSRLEAEETATNHVKSERRQRGKLNERFVILKSMVPSVSKFDKVSILDDTIEYVQELERKVKELESCRAKLEANYDNSKTSRAKKRKSRDIYESEPEFERFATADNINVSINEKDVQIEIKCPWREGMLLEIMDAISNLHLYSHSVQSSTNRGILSLTIKSEVLQRIKCRISWDNQTITTKSCLEVLNLGLYSEIV